jgi:uncharacterized protein YjbI with pentapeptide repeats
MRASIVTILIVIVSLVPLATIVYWATHPDLAPTWTGFGEFKNQKDVQRAKTLWDWLQLLLVPIFLAVGGWLLNRSQKQSEQRVETDRQRQTALEDYFSCMTQLLLEKELRRPKDESKQNIHEEARKIARIRTLGLLRILDGERKGQLMQFLYESGLIMKDPIIDLNGADFRHAILDGATLNGVELRGVYFSHAHMPGIQMISADLRGSDFTLANLTKANLRNANLKQAVFFKTILHGSNRDNIQHEGNEFNGARIYH